MAVQLVKPQLLEFDGNAISEHNRGELSISTERIETKQRMANGAMRKYVIADKRTFSVSWTEFPHDSTLTVDGAWGADDIQSFYDANAGVFVLSIKYDDSRTEDVSVMFSEFSKDITKRGNYDFWELSVTMEEV